jgi:class 3 adenylate cyclase/tetratricopeptide (TPR) repeat protein
MRCASCGFENPEGMRFCEECGTKLVGACPSCGQQVRPTAKFCGACGTTLTQPLPALGAQVMVANSQPPASYTPPHLAERIRAEQAALEARGTVDGERKTITALFADIKGSMALMEDLDPEDARAIIDPVLTLMMDAVHRYEGYVAQSTGDGIFAFFGAPIAHEDHPQRALFAALRMQEESRRLAEQLRVEKGLPSLQIRVGINTGEVVMRGVRKDDLHTDYTPIGHSTGLASRMEGLATPGSIVVSEHTYKLTEGYFAFKPLGAVRVKGVSEPVTMYEVVGVGPFRTRLQVAARRGLARFVGRHSEMAHLKHAFEQAQSSHGQIVGVMGEPGVGKSRLFYEFTVLSQRGCLVLETFSVSHGKASPYLPLIELLKHYFQITPQDDERKIQEKVAGKVLILDRTLEDTLPYLFALLGLAEPTSPLHQMDAQIRRRRTFEALKRVLVRESLNQPLLLIFEDLHWLDTETQAFLALLSESVATAKILLLVNFRPEYRHEWGHKTYYTQLRLDPLEAADAQALLSALLGDDPALQPLKRFILEKTEGNPFFMEELVQALFEQGVVSGGAYGGAPTVARSLTDLHVPTTVQGVLAARIDRLPPAEKALLQTLAVMGKEFSWSLLTQVVDTPADDLPQLLSHLQAAEFIYEQPAFPEVEYSFKHALTQEVAYHSVLIERRKAVHERTAQALEALFPSRLEEFYGDLAHHYSRSGNTQKAIEYLHRAGQQAVQGSAEEQAVTHLRAALRLLDTLPVTPERAAQELRLQLTLGRALKITKGFGSMEVEQVYTRARALCQQVGETPQLFPVLFGLSAFYRNGGDLRTSYEVATQCLTLAERLQSPVFLCAAHLTLGITLLILGELSASQRHLEQAVALYDPHQYESHAFLYGEDPKVVAFSALALGFYALGYPAQALAKSHEALARAREQPRLQVLAFAEAMAARFHQLRQAVGLTQQWAEAALSLSTEHGFRFWGVQGSILRGWALAEQGQTEEGIAQICHGLAAYEAGTETFRVENLGLLAWAYTTAGQREEGLRTVAAALTVVDETGERLLLAELYRLKGELTLQPQARHGQGADQAQARQDRSAVPSPQLPAPSTQAEAEACFHKAIEIACQQQAKSLELRAAMSLSRLWQQQGRREEARQLLAEIYGWFTEGFDTRDLQEAKALLEELSLNR